MALSLVFDLETTGVPERVARPGDLNYPRIVELAAVLIDDSGTELAVTSLVVRPEGWEIPKEAAAVHGITTDAANRIGVPMRLALVSLTNLARNADEVVGHNVGFDIGIVHSELIRFRRVEAFNPRQITCTALLGESICKLPPTQKMIEAGFGHKHKKPKLSELYEHLFGETFEGAHRALADVRATTRCLIEIRRKQKV